MSDAPISPRLRLPERDLDLADRNMTIALKRLGEGDPNPDRRLVAIKALPMPLRGALNGYPTDLRDSFYDAILGLAAFDKLDALTFHQMITPLIDNLRALDGSA